MQPGEHDVGAADLRDGELRGVDVAGEHVVLACTAGRLHAIGGICPHAGAKLHEGVLDGETIVCPWHKAAFHLGDGSCAQPPAVDKVASYAVRVVGGRMLLTMPEPTPARRPPAAQQECFAVLGAGAAGAAAVQTRREAGFAGRIVRISHEDALPYDRTVLSKYTLAGTEGGEKTPLQDAAFYDANRIERWVRRVRSLDIAGRVIVFDDGARLPYDQVLIATGAEPRGLAGPGAGLHGGHVLRSAADAASIVASAEHAAQAIVIGSGFIAMEAAATLRARGMAVTVVAPGEVAFGNRLGPVVGGAIQAVHEREGVAFRLGRRVAAIEGEDRVTRIRLDDGSVLAAGLVIVGVGVTPATQVVQGVALDEDGGIPVGAGLSAAAGVFAAGDVAAFPYRGDGKRVRVEHWRVAQQHGRVAALNMLGHEAAFAAVPYFWTTHFKQRLDYVGHAERWDEVVVDGDLNAPDFIAYYVVDGHVEAVAGWQRDQAMARAIGLMTDRRDWTVADLREALG